MRPKSLMLGVLIATAALLSATGCSHGGRQAEASPAPPTSPGAIATTSVPPTGDPQGQTSTPKVQACELLTKEEVEEIIGEKIDSVEVQEGWGNCIYHKKENFFGEMMYIPRVTVGYTRTDVQARWNYWSSRTDKEVVTGVGDEAVWSPGMGFFVSRVKGGLLMISVGGSDDAAKKSMAVRLAKKAVPRIE